MKKFCVAFMTLYDNEMKQEIVEALNSAEAMSQSSFLAEYDLSDVEMTDEGLRRFAFDCDACIGAMEI